MKNNILTTLLYLKNKTKLALKQVPIDVRKEIENEKNVIKQPSPIADIVKYYWILFLKYIYHINKLLGWITNLWC